LSDAAAPARGRFTILAGIGALCALCWAWLVPAALDMYGPMDGLAAWMMAPQWDLRYATLIFLMWTAMMAAMMLPSALPAILIFQRVAASSAEPVAPRTRTALFAGGYLLAWTVFSLAATLVQYLLWRSGWLDPMMQTPTLAGGALLIAAGIYQFSGLKSACLSACRGPLDFLSRHWRTGFAGALRMGVQHGVFCVGCCWALMLLLFGAGVMNLAWILAIAALVLVEKLAPAGVQFARGSGVLLALAGAALMARGVL
jgi:predicted metal-binding membrane protein